MPDKPTKEAIEYWIDQCLDHETNLTKWEYDFVKSIEEQFEKRGTLSERQCEVLERIYAEKT